MKKISAFLYEKPFLLFILFLVAAYFPVLLPYFHLKNDILTQNLPTRFVFSESLYSGFEPFWNPFLHFGSPQYGDMNNGFWNPVQWIIGAGFGYNIYTITFEELFYLFVGGWGIYKVSREFFDKEIAILTGLAYMASGTTIGHLQYLCWITGTGYFPYVLLYFIRANKRPILKYFLLGGLSVFLFVASTHPGLIIGAAYFFAFALIIIFLNRKALQNIIYHPAFLKINALFFIISCLLSAVVIFSNIEVLNYISRGSKVSLEESLMAPTTFQSYLSLIFPLPVHKSDFFNTDIAMRNAYIGIAHLAGFIYFIRFAPKKLLLSSLLTLSFFILLAGGGLFKTFAWHALPLLGHVRLNGEFTYFVVLILLLSGAYGLHSFLNKKGENANTSGFNLLLLISIGALIIAIPIALYSRASILFTPVSDVNDFKTFIKSTIDAFTFWDALFIQGIIQAVTIALYLKYSKNSNPLNKTFVVNLCLIAWLTLPFTGLGMMSKKEVQSVINKFPRGIAKPEQVPIKQADYIQPKDNRQYLLLASYSKKIGHPETDQYPVQLKKNVEFTNDSVLYDFITDQSYLFLCKDTSIGTETSFGDSTIHVLDFGPGRISTSIRNTDFNWLILLQNNYPNWEVFVNGERIKHYTAFKTFIAVPVEKGNHTIMFKFNSQIIKWVLLGNMLFILIALGLAIHPTTGKRLLLK